MECQHSLSSGQNENDKFNLFKILPFLRNDKTTYTKLLTKLEEMEIDEGDLEFVEVEDLVPTLHHIKAKRLVAGWRKKIKIGDGKVTFSAADSTMCVKFYQPTTQLRKRTARQCPEWQVIRSFWGK